MEVKYFVSCFFIILSSSSNPLFLNNDSNLLILSGCWQAICEY